VANHLQNARGQRTCPGGRNAAPSQTASTAAPSLLPNASETSATMSTNGASQADLHSTALLSLAPETQVTCIVGYNSHIVDSLGAAAHPNTTSMVTMATASSKAVLARGNGTAAESSRCPGA